MAFEVAKTSTQTIFESTFELLGAIGRGGNSVVYRARALPESRNASIYPDTIALKVFLDTEKHPEENIARVKRESLALLAARHENVIRVYDYVATPSLCYMTMELAPDGDLKQILDRGPVAPKNAMRLALQLLRGLEAIHRVGLLHCDIKPENLLISGDALKISDFGIAVLPTERRRRLSSLSLQGTMDYLAPELLDGSQVSPQSDLYSAAITIYELFTRSFPFKGTTLAESVSAKLAGRVELFPGFPDAVRKLLVPVFRRALAPKVEERFLNVVDFRRTLEACSNVVDSLKLDSINTARKKKLTTPVASPQKIEVPAGVESEPIIRASKDQFIPTRRRSPRNFRTALYSFAGLLVLGTAIALLADRKPAEASLAPGAEATAKQELGLLQSLRSLFSNDAPRSFEQLEPLTKGIHHGVISNLFAEGENISLVTQGSGVENEFYIALGIPGWTPQKVALNPNSKSRRMEVSASGATFTFWVNEEPTTKGAIISGRYRDGFTQREGTWSLFDGPVPN